MRILCLSFSALAFFNFSSSCAVGRPRTKNEMIAAEAAERHGVTQQITISWTINLLKSLNCVCTASEPLLVFSKQTVDQTRSSKSLGKENTIPTPHGNDSRQAT